MKIHFVKQGDTLETIARKYGVGEEDVRRANPRVSDWEALGPGAKVIIPDAVPVRVEPAKPEPPQKPSASGMAPKEPPLASAKDQPPNQPVDKAAETAAGSSSEKPAENASGPAAEKPTENVSGPAENASADKPAEKTDELKIHLLPKKHADEPYDGKKDENAWQNAQWPYAANTEHSFPAGAGQADGPAPEAVQPYWSFPQPATEAGAPAYGPNPFGGLTDPAFGAQWNLPFSAHSEGPSAAVGNDAVSSSMPTPNEASSNLHMPASHGAQPNLNMPAQAASSMGKPAAYDANAHAYPYGGQPYDPTHMFASPTHYWSYGANTNPPLSGAPQPNFPMSGEQSGAENVDASPSKAAYLHHLPAHDAYANWPLSNAAYGNMPYPHFVPANAPFSVGAYGYDPTGYAPVWNAGAAYHHIPGFPSAPCQTCGGSGMKLPYAMQRNGTETGFPIPDTMVPYPESAGTVSDTDVRDDRDGTESEERGDDDSQASLKSRSSGAGKTQNRKKKKRAPTASIRRTASRRESASWKRSESKPWISH